MGVLDEIRKLDEQRAALLAKAKQEALDQASAAIATLRELGSATGWLRRTMALPLPALCAAPASGNKFLTR